MEKGIRIPKFKKVWLVEFRYLGGFGIRNTVQEIQNPTKDWNPESKFPWQTIPVILESGLSWIPLYGPQRYVICMSVSDPTLSSLYFTLFFLKYEHY